MVSRPIIIVGAGGHGRILLDTLLAAGLEVFGFVEKQDVLQGSRIMGVKVYPETDMAQRFPSGAVRLVNGIGSVDVPTVRRSVYVRLKAFGYDFLSVTHPAAVVAADVVLGEGVQIMAGCVVQTGATLGPNTLVNTKASIDHDCRLAEHVHLAPGVTLSGNVSVGECVHIGTGATVIQGIGIGREAFVAAGALVTKDISAGVRVAGVPAREL